MNNTAIQPFFFSEGPAEHRPEPYVLPEFAPATHGLPVEEAPKIAAEEHSFTAADIEQREKDAFDRGFGEGRAEGHTEGHSEGLAEGLKTGEETTAARIEEMTKVYAGSLAEVAALKDTLRVQVEEEVVRLALAVARKIIHREIQIDHTIIHTLVRVALERVAGKSAVVVRLSPVDYEYMTREHGDMSKKAGREIVFESDNTLTQGSCMIQTETGDIDARIEEEFHEVESLFFEG
ncbi:MAG: hypothetical protein LBJ21_09695 [Acidobacteriota bacterium]|nr:hypothetical protein [Acidobacteriota bacterium]